MGVSLDRRALLRGRLKPEPGIFRPPNAREEDSFRDFCQSCPDCVSACEEDIIRLDKQGYPKLVFGHSECTFCGDCESACPTGALDSDNGRPWDVIASVKGGCLAFNAIVCRACGDNCDEEAIRFKLMVNGRSLPMIDGAACTGCGACAAVCPNKSIVMKQGGEREAFAATEGSA